jgi:hypothetical protein
MMENRDDVPIGTEQRKSPTTIRLLVPVTEMYPYSYISPTDGRLPKCMIQLVVTGVS